MDVSSISRDQMITQNKFGKLSMVFWYIFTFVYVLTLGLRLAYQLNIKMQYQPNIRRALSSYLYKTLATNYSTFLQLETSLLTILNTQ